MEATKSNLTHAQRFDVTVTNNTVYAPFSWGCPSMIFAVDRSVFKKTLGEKMKLFTFKKHLGKTKNHKFKLQFKGAF